MLLFKHVGSVIFFIIEYYLNSNPYHKCIFKCPVNSNSVSASYMENELRFIEYNNNNCQRMKNNKVLLMNTDLNKD